MLQGKSNIVHEQLIDSVLSGGSDFALTNSEPFFFHTTVGGAIKYTPANDTDANAVTKTLNASDIYNSPVMAKKIFHTGTTATGVWIGSAI
jgi:hypothetical protein